MTCNMKMLAPIKMRPARPDSERHEGNLSFRTKCAHTSTGVHGAQHRQLYSLAVELHR